MPLLYTWVPALSLRTCEPLPPPKVVKRATSAMQICAHLYGRPKGRRKDCGRRTSHSVYAVPNDLEVLWPEVCKSSNIIVTDKKRRQGLKNYRPISLLCVACKLFTKVIANRIRTTLHFNHHNHQAGFCKGYSTVEHIHTINHTVEKREEYDQPLSVYIVRREALVTHAFTQCVPHKSRSFLQELLEVFG